MRVWLLIGVLVGALVLAGVAFALPWLPATSEEPPMLEKYAPLRDGDAFFLLGKDTSGKPLNWTSRTLEILPTSRALAGELSDATRDAIQKLMRHAGESEIDIDTLAARLDEAVIYRQTDRTVDADGQLSEIVTIVVRDARGETVVSSFFPSSKLTVVFDPPLLALPAEFQVGSEWASEGTAGSVPYIWQSRVISRDTEQDCWTVESTIQLAAKTRTEADYCAGKGIVATRVFDEAGVPVETSQVFFRDAPLPNDALDAYVAVASTTVDSPDTNFENWTLERLRRVGRNISAGEATIPPLWLPTVPPQVLASGYLGAFFSYDATDPAATPLWSFPAGGTVYSPPVYDDTTGRVYFGASDKRLYALDARGMFLWSFVAGDNIAARPLVVEGLVIFGSEDRHIYAVLSGSGEPDWIAETSSPIVSAAAYADGSVIVGSDDGTVYALDIDTGRTRWTFGADDAIQAPIVTADGTAYAASRSGTLYALDAATGEERWSADAGAELNFAPLVENGRVYAVASDGSLTSFEAETGAQVWRTTGTSFSGTPIALNGALIVAGSDGNLYRLDADGKVTQTWSSAAVSGAANRFVQSPAMGGDAIWLVDDRAGLWRLGAPRARIAALNPTWGASIAEAPFEQFALTTSAAAYGERAVVLDEGSNVYVVDARNGSAERVGQILSGGSGATRLDPVVDGDTLLTVIGQTLYATNLTDGRELWELQGRFATYRPVTVAGEVVLWTQLDFDASGLSTAKGTVTAVDRATGEVRWQKEIEGRGFPSGVVVGAGTVYTAEPAAYDLETGNPVWRAELEGWTAGEPALSADGKVLYVPASDGEAGAVLALDASDGTVLWQKPTSTNTPSFVEQAYVVDDTVIVSGLMGKVAALDANDGSLRWTFEPPAPRLGTLDAADGRVWMMLQDGRVIGVDAKTGELAAQFADLDISLTSGVTQHPVMIDGTLVVPYRTVLMGLRPTP